jgi:hypothetical protein
LDQSLVAPWSAVVYFDVRLDRTLTVNGFAARFQCQPIEQHGVADACGEIEKAMAATAAKARTRLIAAHTTLT